MRDPYHRASLPRASFRNLISEFLLLPSDSASLHLPNRPVAGTYRPILAAAALLTPVPLLRPVQLPLHKRHQRLSTDDLLLIHPQREQATTSATMPEQSRLSCRPRPASAQRLGLSCQPWPDHGLPDKAKEDLVEDSVGFLGPIHLPQISIFVSRFHALL